jgi:hypothetical protein
MQNKIHTGTLKKYILNDNMIIWKIEDSLSALNIYVDGKDEELLTDSDINSNVYFKLRKVFLGRENGQDMNMDLAYNLRFEINSRAQKAEASQKV